MKPYGKELILDLHNCNTKRFNLSGIGSFLNLLCDEIEMNPCEIHFWYYEDDKEYQKAPNHLKGISAIQFITTSNITIHTLDVLKKVFINIFSCKNFDTEKATKFCEKLFEGEVVKSTIIDRL